jgi:hypothetical protein
LLYFANPCGPAVTEAMGAGALGFIDTPAQGNKRPAGVAWCADNGCFGQGWPGADKWLAWLAKNAYAAADCLFATAPDVVGDAAATLERSAPYLPMIRALGYPAALVAQNGIEDVEVPWDTFDALFVGGSLECLPCSFVWPSDKKPGRRQRCPSCQRLLTEWKTGAVARDLVREAKARGKWVHMGRVNSELRYRLAYEMACDSVDGTYLVFGPRVNLPKLLAWSRVEDQPALFAA